MRYDSYHVFLISKLRELELHEISETCMPTNSVQSSCWEEIASCLRVCNEPCNMKDCLLSSRSVRMNL